MLVPYHCLNVSPSYFNAVLHASVIICVSCKLVCLLCQPMTCLGAKIEEILLHWKGDYDKLERHHGYIQW